MRFVGPFELRTVKIPQVNLAARRCRAFDEILTRLLLTTTLTASQPKNTTKTLRVSDVPQCGTVRHAAFGLPDLAFGREN